MQANGTFYLKQLDLRGRQRALESTNPRYPVLFVIDHDEFVLIGAVVTQLPE
jgi:SOS-response transcriptional repressor LexA